LPTKTNPCPARCSAANPPQHSVEGRVLKDAGIVGDWLDRAMRCGYCGEIYSADLHGVKTRHGHFEGNELIRAENWRPYPS
jgi:hypothetical protein